MSERQLVVTEGDAAQATALFGSLCDVASARGLNGEIRARHVVLIGEAEWCEWFAAEIHGTAASVHYCIGEPPSETAAAFAWAKKEKKSYTPASTSVLREGGIVSCPALPEPASRDLSDSAPEDWPDYHDERPDAASTFLHSVQTASAVKAMRSEDIGRPWSEPMDVFGDAAPPEWDYAALPREIQPFSDDQADRAGLDPAMQGLFCYAACSALIRGGIAVEMQQGDGEGRVWREKPVLWAAAVGDPSTGKGPAMDVALDRLYRIAMSYRAHEDEARRKHENASAIHKLRVAAYQREAVKNPQALEPEALAALRYERIWTDDATREAVPPLIIENERLKITIIKDELAGWFGSFGAYSAGGAEKDRSDWLSFYEARERFIDRVNARSYHVPSWGGCIIGGIQPSTLARVAAKLGDDGMLQRFQLVTAKPKRKVAARPADNAAIRHWNEIQDNLAALVQPPYSVQLDPDAAEFTAAKRDWLFDTMLLQDSDALKFALGKWAGLHGRLMITSHCITAAAQGHRTPPPRIALRTAQQAWAWIERVLYPHAVQFYGQHMSGASGFDAALRQIALWLVCRSSEFKERVKRRDVHIWCRSAWKPEGTDAFVAGRRRALIEALTAGDWLRATKRGRTGELDDDFLVNPEIDRVFARLRAEEMPKRKARYDDMEARKTAKAARGDDD